MIISLGTFDEEHRNESIEENISTKGIHLNSC